MNSATAHTMQTAPSKAAQQCRILVVDDDVLSRRLITHLLGRTSTSCAVSVAEDGQQAWNLYQQNGADLIITDNSMPVMDGITLVRAIRRQRSPIPIIMLSGSPDIEDKAFAVGVSAFLEKPVDIHDLVQTIGQLLPRTQLSLRRN